MKNNKQVQTKSSKTTEEILNFVLQTAKKMGATDAAVSVNHDTGFAVDVRMGSVDTVQFSDDRHIGVSVYKGKRKASASTTDLSEPSIKATVQKAYEIAEVSAEDPCFGLADKELITKVNCDLDLYHPWAIEPKEAIELAIDCEAKALKYDKRIVNTDGFSISTYAFNHGYANTHGALGVIKSTMHSISGSLIAEENGKMQRDYDYTTARDKRLLTQIDDLALSVAKRTIDRLGARKIKTQKAPVIFDNRTAAGLISSFVSAIRGSNLYKKNSFLVDALNTKIFPSFINIREHPHILGALGSAPFDADGVPTRENVFIEKGVLKQYALSSYTARRLGTKTTANAGGVFNLSVSSNTDTFAELVAKMQTGFIVTSLMGQGVNILTGDYSRGASGFWVENGKIQFPVEEVTIAGNLRDMFQNIKAISDDVNPNYATQCGSILISEMMIGGE